MFAHLADDLEPIGVGVLIDRQRARRLAAQPAGGVVVLGIELDPGDVAQPDDRAVVAAADDDLLELLDVVSRPLVRIGYSWNACPGGDRLAADLARGRLAVLGLDRLDHLDGGINSLAIRSGSSQIRIAYLRPNTLTSLTPATRFRTSST